MLMGWIFEGGRRWSTRSFDVAMFLRSKWPLERLCTLACRAGLGARGDRGYSGFASRAADVVVSAATPASARSVGDGRPWFVPTVPATVAHARSFTLVGWSLVSRRVARAVSAWARVLVGA